MVKRFLAAFVLILVYLAVWAGFLYGVVLLAQEDEGLLLTAILAMMAFLILAFVPYLDQVIKRVFFFRGEGQPIPAGTLRRQLLSINRLRNVPVMAEERLYDLVLTWKYADARWWEMLAHSGMKRIYELHVKLDEERRLATLIDVRKSVKWRAGPTQVHIGGGFSRGVLLAYEIGESWGIQENWQPGVEYKFEFAPQEIKSPVMNTILRSGWDVRFGIW
jgi:hypothetical protein